MSIESHRYEKALRAREAGRSWADVADLIGGTVAEARQLLEPSAAAARAFRAASEPNERARGLLERCVDCGCALKDHGGTKGREPGGCAVCGPEHSVWAVSLLVDGEWVSTETVGGARPRCPDGADRLWGWSVQEQWRGCGAFRSRQDEDAHLAYSASRLRSQLGVDAIALGVEVRSRAGGWWRWERARGVDSRIGGPSLKHAVRRARRKAAKERAK